MDGLLSYADIFANWIKHLSVFWGFLNSNVLSTVESAINTASGNPDAYLSVAFLNMVKLVLQAFGFGNLTVLGFMFSMMGTAFSIYFGIMMIRWVLDILP